MSDVMTANAMDRLTAILDEYGITDITLDMLEEQVALTAMVLPEARLEPATMLDHFRAVYLNGITDGITMSKGE